MFAHLAAVLVFAAVLVLILVLALILSLVLILGLVLILIIHVHFLHTIIPAYYRIQRPAICRLLR